jgi:hypothetical protein
MYNYSAELESPENPKEIFVLGNYCRFHYDPINKCGCGVCCELRESCKEDYRYVDSDEYHYVWVSDYEVLPSWVLNSNPAHALRGDSYDRFDPGFLFDYKGRSKFDYLSFDFDDKRDDDDGDEDDETKGDGASGRASSSGSKRKKATASGSNACSSSSSSSLS